VHRVLQLVHDHPGRGEGFPFGGLEAGELGHGRGVGARIQLFQ
jgi:hypothetical protein